MKKRVAAILCVACVLTLMLGLMAGCKDIGKEDDKADQVIGTWIGKCERNEYHGDKYFWAEIKRSEDGKKIIDNIYQVNAFDPAGGQRTVQMPHGTFYYNNVKETIVYDVADLSGYDSSGRDFFYYTVTMDGKDKFICAGEEKIFISSLEKKFINTYTFERTTLTLEEYEEQIRGTQK